MQIYKWINGSYVTTINTVRCLGIANTGFYKMTKEQTVLSIVEEFLGKYE